MKPAAAVQALPPGAEVSALAGGGRAGQPREVLELAAIRVKCSLAESIYT